MGGVDNAFHGGSGGGARRSWKLRVRLITPGRFARGKSDASIAPFRGAETTARVVDALLTLVDAQRSPR
jgi:hypothetical protein